MRHLILLCACALPLFAAKTPPETVMPKPDPALDGALILPFVDAKGQLSELGTALALLGLERATYLPGMRLRTQVSALPAVFHELRLFEKGETISPRARAVLGALNHPAPLLEGTLVRDGDTVTLTLGRDGRATFPYAKLHEAPEWIARELHRQIGHPLSRDEAGYLARPALRDTASLEALARLEPAFGADRPDRDAYRKLLAENPDSAYLAVRVLRDGGALEKVDQRFPGHGGVAYEVARNAQALPELHALVKAQSRNFHAYAMLSAALRKARQGEVARAALDEWVAREPGSSAPYFLRGDFYVSWAWDARGSDVASKVSSAGWKQFEERLLLARKDLEQAVARNAKYVDAYRRLITVCMGLSLDRDTMEKWFAAGAAVDPLDYGLHAAKLAYLMPKWHGTPEDMLAFAHECARRTGKGSALPLLLVSAHEELQTAYEDAYQAEGEHYLRQDAAYLDLKRMFEACLAADPTPGVLNAYAKAAVDANDFVTAHLLFERIGDDFRPGVWGSREDFDHARQGAASDFAINGPFYKKHGVTPTTAVADPPDPVWARNVALYYSSFVNPGVHDAAKALRYARAAEKRCPDNPGIVEALACALARSGDYRAAVETQERAIRLLRASDSIGEEARSCTLPRLESQLALFRAGKPYQGEQ